MQLLRKNTILLISRRTFVSRCAMVPGDPQVQHWLSECNQGRAAEVRHKGETEAQRNSAGDWLE